MPAYVTDITRNTSISYLYITSNTSINYITSNTSITYIHYQKYLHYQQYLYTLPAMPTLPAIPALPTFLQCLFHPLPLAMPVQSLLCHLTDYTIKLFNSRSLVNKLSDFQSLVYSSSFSTICVTETWLSDYIFNYKILPCNYTMYRKDRNSRGGGVLIAIDNSIPSCCIHSPADLELVCVQVGMSHPFYLCTIYTPPSAT